MRAKKPKPGDGVILVGLPPHFLDDLPEDEQEAISARVGTPIRLVAWDGFGRAELEFNYRIGKHDIIYHTLWVGPEFIRPLKPRRKVGPKVARDRSRHRFAGFTGGFAFLATRH